MTPETLPMFDPSVHPVGRNTSRKPGQQQLAMLEYLGLGPDTRLMEIGCGIGRLVYELGNRFPGLTYAGFDISTAAIAWLNENYAPLLANYRFDVVDVANARYRKDAEGDAAAVRFPYEDNSFDMAVSNSVFTHMRLPEIEHYLTELARVLVPGGRGAMTYFALTDFDVSPRLGDGNLPFLEIEPGVYTTDPELPERAIAFSDELIRESAARAGLEVVQTLEGTWHGHPHRQKDVVLQQDVYVFTPQRRRWRGLLRDLQGRLRPSPKS